MVRCNSQRIWVSQALIFVLMIFWILFLKRENFGRLEKKWCYFFFFRKGKFLWDASFLFLLKNEWALLFCLFFSWKGLVNIVKTLEILKKSRRFKNFLRKCNFFCSFLLIFFLVFVLLFLAFCLRGMLEHAWIR